MVEWIISRVPIEYPEAMKAMDRRVSQIASGDCDEAVWLLEHPSIYTAGKTSVESDFVKPTALPVYRTGRGGQITYHGPGQRVAYLMLDLNGRGKDVRQYVRRIEQWIIASLQEFGVAGFRRPGRTGVWISRKSVGNPGSEEKIAAIGLRLKRWVSLHGASINVSPDLSHYSSIVPCGLPDYRVTSLADLGIFATMDEVDDVLQATFEDSFGNPVGWASGNPVST